MTRKSVLFCILLVSGLGLPAMSANDDQELTLERPVDCEPGKTCWVVQYPDTDPGPGVRDSACGSRSYDGHKGVDIAVGDVRDIAAGVDVLAAAGGVVIGIRDGMTDVFIKDDADIAALNGQDCGNGVRIDHGDGWATQYCHMRKGSVLVRSGDKVATGQKLGLMGYSGSTEFPHLHVQVIRDDETYDPFADKYAEAGCSPDASNGMWSKASGIAYAPVAIANSGFATSAVSMEGIGAGDYDGVTLTKDSPAMVFWTVLYGVAEGDELLIMLTGPGKTSIVDQTIEIPRNRARQMQFTGKKKPPGGWSVGSYSAEVRVKRDGVVIASQTFSTKVRP